MPKNQPKKPKANSQLEIPPYQDRVIAFDKELTKLKKKYHLELRVVERTVNEIKAIDTAVPTRTN